MYTLIWIAQQFVSLIFLFLDMTLDEAFIDFTQSDTYREIAKQNNSLGGKFRGYLSRFNTDKLKSGAIVEILMANGYTVTADKLVTKNTKRKVK
jgi:hypothetical protein